MKIAKLNTIVYVDLYEGFPLVRCTLKGVYETSYGSYGRVPKYLWVVKPLETARGYYKGKLDTCREIIPASCCKWTQKGLKFNPLPFRVEWDNLPLFEAHDLD